MGNPHAAAAPTFLKACDVQSTDSLGRKHAIYAPTNHIFDISY